MARAKKRKEWAAAVLPKRNQDKAAFCSSLDWGIEVRWFDKTGIHQLGDGRLARIELETRGTCGHFPGFLVTVLSKQEGKVDAKYFRFDDYMSRELRDREDARDDYPVGGNLCYEVIAHCGYDWYIARPLETRPFCGAIEAYLEAFR